MNFSVFINHWIAFASVSPFISIIAIIIGTFILEDATTIIVALAVASNQLPFGTALIALYVGVIMGDLGLYAIGHLTSRHSGAKKIACHARLEPFREWLHNHLYIAIFSVRFVPGLRLPTYTAAGFFHLPFKRYALTVLVATVVWATVLFSLTYYFGMATKEFLGVWRWPVGISIALLLFFLGRMNMKKYNNMRNQKVSVDVAVTRDNGYEGRQE